LVHPVYNLFLLIIDNFIKGMIPTIFWMFNHTWKMELWTEFIPVI
jgi:hypothetical protein